MPTGSAQPPRDKTSLSELIWGTRQTLIIAFAAGGLATIVSVIVGVSAAYMGGLVDGVLSLITDVLLVIPIFPLVIVIAAYLRSVGLLVMIIVLGALGWSYGARQLRVQVLSLRRRDFLGAARVRGERSGYIIVAEIIPTMTSLIVASFLGTAVFAVLTAAGLQFLGLGDPNSQSWGNMLYWAQNNEALEAGSPLWAIVPGACIALLGAAFAFLNYAFDEVSNPALRPVRKLSRRSVRRAQRASGMTGTSPTPGSPSQAVPAPARRASLKPRATGFPTADGREATCSRSATCPLRTLPTPDRCWPSRTWTSTSMVGSSSPSWASPAAASRRSLYAIAQLLNPPAGITGGSVNFSGREMAMMSDKKLRRIRWRELSVVMQSAMNALNPVMTVGEQMRDACKTHAAMSNKQIAERSAEVLRLVSIDPVHLSSYPHQLSGGMRQRAMIAMALLFTPQLVIMDEPTSALDVVAQRSLMRQIKDLQQQLGFAVIFVTHDISLVRHYSDRLLVMYAGQVAELGATAEVIGTPRHPYSSALLEAFPSVRGEKVTLTGIAGSPPNLASPPSGCRFHPRCADAMSECSVEEPPLYLRGSSMVRCLLYRDGAGALESLAGRSVRRLDEAAVVGPTTSRRPPPRRRSPTGRKLRSWRSPG